MIDFVVGIEHRVVESKLHDFEEIVFINIEIGLSEIRKIDLGRRGPFLSGQKFG